MNNKASRFSFRILILDFIFLTISFFALNYYKRGTLILSPNYYIKLLIAFYCIWFCVSLLIKKFRIDSYYHCRDALLLIVKSAVFYAYLVSLMVVIIGLPAFSRIHIFGTCVLLFFLNLMAFALFYLSSTQKFIKTEFKRQDSKTKLSTDFAVILILADFFIITVLFYGINYIKRGTFILSDGYEKLLLIIYGLWFVTALVTRKFDKRNFQSYIFAIAPCAKAVVLMTLTMSVFIFAFRLFFFSRGQIFGSFLLLFLCEAVLYYAYYNWAQNGRRKKDIESIDEVKAVLEQHALSPEGKDRDTLPGFIEPVKDRLKDKDLSSYPWLFDFINQSIDLLKIDKSATACLSTRDMYNVQTIEDSSLRLFINLHKVNDTRWLNRYFLEIFRKLDVGGYFVSKANTTFTHRRWFFDNYPKYFAEIFYTLHLILFRVLPKLPGVKKMYLAITDGTNRTISRGEVLGRLCFCGFEIVAESEIDYHSYFIARKVKTPSADTSPTYGPLVKLKRTGFNGRVITVYKFRTMHPYAEYLQDHMFKENKLREGGKIDDDYRLTGWGRFMRRTWLDELPMIYNWLRGEVKLFGVRPLSMQYLSLYTDELKEMRNRIKPGLIPPFYADLPKTLAEICDSEKRYIEAYLEKPLRTQWVYFWKVFSNIVIKGIRSN